MSIFSALIFGLPVSLFAIGIIGTTNSLVGLGLSERSDAQWIWVIMILCVGFGFIFNAMDRLVDMVKTKPNGEARGGINDSKQ
ncbi:MAG: hypothetical protein AAB766_00215 [Patescibacteria group bacterium]